MRRGGKTTPSIEFDKEVKRNSANKLRLFGTSGIRGTANVEITPELAIKLGVTFASFFGNEGTVAVGRDVRLPAELLHYAFIAGVLAGGVDVEDCGVAPTPAVLWAVKKRGLDGAAVVTGSHTPSEMIGFLFFMRDTAEFSVRESHRFEKIFFNKPKVVAWNGVGKCSEVDVSDLYLRSVLEHVNLRKAASSGFKVVIDTGNGASALVCDKIFRAAGVKIIAINGEPDGTFPNRDPYPRPEVLSELAKEVNENKADIGSATDGDGDRAIFVDGDGNVLWGDISGCIFAKAVLKKHGGGGIAVPINTSQLIECVCNAHNGKITYTKVGPPNIVSDLKRVKALFGMEETGKTIWPETILYGDWALATLKMLEIIAKEQKSLLELVQEFPRFHMRKKAFRCPETLKNAVMINALEEWKKKEEEAEVITIDGAKIIYPDGSWMLLRPSGTEPVFRVYVESQDFTRVKELIKVGSELIQHSLLHARAC
jgi:phosphomannomutase/phosphoglucomutase